eukprot:Rhum_TRINITY_DN14996_c6_g1::Rhum_TRINITY_DN14996_c6_g1_i1::g.132337::m.132337
MHSVRVRVCLCGGNGMGGGRRCDFFHRRPPPPHLPAGVEKGDIGTASSLQLSVGVHRCKGRQRNPLSAQRAQRGRRARAQPRHALPAEHVPAPRSGRGPVPPPPCTQADAAASHEAFLTAVVCVRVVVGGHVVVVVAAAAAAAAAAARRVSARPAPVASGARVPQAPLRQAEDFDGLLDEDGVPEPRVAAGAGRRRVHEEEACACGAAGDQVVGAVDEEEGQVRPVQLLHQLLRPQLQLVLLRPRRQTRDELRQVLRHQVRDDQPQQCLRDAPRLRERLHPVQVDGDQVAVLLAQALPSAAAGQQVVRALPGELQLLLHAVHPPRAEETCGNLLHVVDNVALVVLVLLRRTHHVRRRRFFEHPLLPRRR